MPLFAPVTTTTSSLISGTSSAVHLSLIDRTFGSTGENYRLRRLALPLQAARSSAMASSDVDAVRPSGAARLSAPELRVPAAAIDEFLVGAPLDDLAVFEDDDLIGTDDRREAVGDDERGSVLGERVERRLDALFGVGVDVAGRLVEDEDGQVLQDDAGDGDALALSPESLTPRSPTRVS